MIGIWICAFCKNNFDASDDKQVEFIDDDGDVSNCCVECSKENLEDIK